MKFLKGEAVEPENVVRPNKEGNLKLENIPDGFYTVHVRKHGGNVVLQRIYPEWRDQPSESDE